jgi:hypothetical protein
MRCPKRGSRSSLIREDGGFGVVDGYKLEKSVLARAEIIKIVAGLKGSQLVSLRLVPAPGGFPAFQAQADE